MPNPRIICVAIAGSLPGKASNPAVPVSLSEQVAPTQKAFEAGASIVHPHMRDEDETPPSDPGRFAALKAGIEKRCPGRIVQVSAGGRSGAGRTRGGTLSLRPDMAPLSVASNDVPARFSEDPPELVDWLAAEMLVHEVKPEIETFDLRHIFKAKELADTGQLMDTPYIEFVMGVKNAKNRQAA